jgi:hypothetical protein
MRNRAIGQSVFSIEEVDKMTMESYNAGLESAHDQIYRFMQKRLNVLEAAFSTTHDPEMRKTFNNYIEGYRAGLVAASDFLDTQQPDWKD